VLLQQFPDVMLLLSGGVGGLLQKIEQVFLMLYAAYPDSKF